MMDPWYVIVGATCLTLIPTITIGIISYYAKRDRAQIDQDLVEVKALIQNVDSRVLHLTKEFLIAIEQAHKRIGDTNERVARLEGENKGRHESDTYKPFKPK